MASKRITQLTELTTLDDADLVPVVDNSTVTTKKITLETLRTWLEDLFNPQTYYTVGFSDENNYQCDGTADNVQIQAAINDAASNNVNDVVINDEGTYDIQAAISVPTGVRVFMKSRAVVLRLANNTNVSIFVNSDTSSGNTDITIQGGTLDGNKANQTAFTGGLIHFWKGSRYKVIDVYVKNSYFKGVYGQEIAHSDIQYTEVDAPRSNGIDLFYLCNYNVISNNYVHDNNTQYVGILVNRNSSYNIIENNVVDSISDDGIQLRGYYTATLDVNTIAWQSGNIVRYTFSGSPNLSSYSVGQEYASRSSTNAVNDGVFRIYAVNDGSDYIEVYNPNVSSGATDEGAGSPATGMVVTEYTSYNVIRNNIIRNVGIVIGGQGILINEVGNKDNIAIGNTIYRARVNGIEITADAGNQTIIGNTVIEAGYQGGELVDALSEGYGIQATTNATHVISMNTVKRSWRAGYNVSDSATVSNNQSEDNGLSTSTPYGFQFGNNCTIVNNTASETRTGAQRTQTYGYVSGSGTGNYINGNKGINNVTAAYNITSTNQREFFDDGLKQYMIGLNARGRTIQGLTVQAVSAGGGLGGYMTRESNDVLAFYANRSTSTSTDDVIRFYIKDNGGNATLVGGMTGSTTPYFYFPEIKATSKFGLNVTPVAAQTIDANTNNVTSGGSSGVIANFTDLTTYANDAATIRNDIYQLARSVKQVTDALRAFGLGV